MPSLMKMTAALIKAGLTDWIKKQEEKPQGKAIVKKAMEMAFDRNYAWAFRSDQDDERFQAACAAAHVLLDERDRQILLHEVKALQSITAAISGVPVDFEKLNAGMDHISPEDYLGVFMLFRNEKDKQSCASTPSFT